MVSTEAQLVMYVLGCLQKLEEDGYIEGRDPITLLPDGWVTYAMVQDKIQRGELELTVEDLARILLGSGLVDEGDWLSLGCIIAEILRLSRSPDV